MRAACGIIIALSGTLSGCSVILREPFLSLADATAQAFEIGPGTGIRWMHPGLTYPFRFDLKNPTDIKVQWDCRIESVELSTADPNYLASTAKCHDFAGYSLKNKNLTEFSIEFSPGASRRGVYKVSVEARHPEGLQALSTFYIGVRENWVQSNVLGVFDAQYARLVELDGGQTLPAPASSGCYDLEWRDLSGHQKTGELRDFSSCGAQRGWVGSGGDSDPYALAINGAATGYVLVEDPDHFNSTTGELTLESFARLDNLSTGRALLHKWTWTSGARGFSLEFLNSNWRPMQVLGAPQRGVTSTVPVVASQWFHLVRTFRNSNDAAALYINGVNTFTGSSPGDLAATAIELHIGGRSDGPTSGNVAGQIARTAVYDRVLTIEEILQNCNAFKARFAGMTCGP